MNSKSAQASSATVWSAGERRAADTARLKAYESHGAELFGDMKSDHDKLRGLYLDLVCENAVLEHRLTVGKGPKLVTSYPIEEIKLLCSLALSLSSLLKSKYPSIADEFQATVSQLQLTAEMLNNVLPYLPKEAIAYAPGTEETSGA